LVTPDDIDSDSLISRLAGPLPAAARDDFRRAAEAALAAVPCQGDGVVYRTLAPLQRKFFDPPLDSRTSWDIGVRSNRLTDQPPLERGRDRRRTLR
jgi:hypothetical protein